MFDRADVCLQMSSSQEDCRCGICGKTLATKFSLSRHVMLYSSVNFECHVCGKTYHTKTLCP